MKRSEKSYGNVVFRYTYGGVKLSIRIEEQLFSAQSEVQRIDVLESKDFGKILVVDGDLMLTERDEFIYHEMITHVPMAVHPM